MELNSEQLLRLEALKIADGDLARAADIYAFLSGDTAPPQEDPETVRGRATVNCTFGHDWIHSLSNETAICRRCGVTQGQIR